MAIAYLYPTADLGLPVAHYELHQAQTTIGRHPGNDISLLLDSVSRHHARIDHHGGAWTLHDLNSSNGTFLNGERIGSPRSLVEGDVVTFGRADFLFSFYSPTERLTRPSVASPPSCNAELSTSSISLMDDALGNSVILSTKLSSEATPLPDSGAYSTGETVDVEMLRQAHDRLLTLYRLGEMIHEARSTDAMFEGALDLVFENLPVDRGVILELDPVDGTLEPRRTKFRDEGESGELSISRTIVQKALDERVAILSRDVRIDSRFSSSESIVAGDIRSAMCVPLVSKKRIMGILFVDTRESVHAFGDDDLAFLSSIANDLAMSLDNQALQQENIHNERLAAIGQTIAGLAHNIKNILQLAKGGIELMDTAMTRKSLDEMEVYWPMVRRGIDRMQALTQEMLAYSRQTQPHLVEAAVNDIIRDTLDSFEKDAVETGVELKLELATDLPLRHIDPDGLQKALLNLLTNAVDAFDKGPGTVVISTSLEGDNVAVRVRDNGKGIPREKQAKIFQPFFTTKGSRGTGLGLSMTRKYIEDMGGSVTVESQEGQGTTFLILLPHAASLIRREANGYSADPLTSV